MDLSILGNLTKEEKDAVLAILDEFANNGNSTTFNNMLYQDYEEIPVDIVTFLHDPIYLGKGLTDSEGRFTLFPYWEELLKEIYPDPLKPAKYNTLALTGAIGLGKSTEAVIIGCYELYRMLCLKDPYIYYGLQPIDLITFAVINITKDAAQGVAWSKLQSLIQSSEWFMKRGTMTRGDSPEWRPPKGIELIYGSQTRHILGRAVFWAFEDEVSFIPNQDIGKQIEKAKNLVNTATTRMQSRFMKGDVNPTIFCLASSKRTTQSFMETFIEEKKKNESKTTKIVDEPQWIIRTDKDSKEKFKVAVGNRFLENEIIPLDASDLDVEIFRRKGYQIIEVPIGYYENFVDDLDIALTDIAGISASNTTRYISGERWSQNIDESYKNLFIKEIIEVGNSKDDNSQYYDFIDLSRLDRSLLDRPLFIHLDMSLSGDKTGIAGTWIIGKKPHTEGTPNNKELMYKLAFHVSVKAPKGHQISFEKNRNLIRWLREQGFYICGVSYDTFQSADLAQQLQNEDFNCSTISVDRVTDRLCLPYAYFKNTIYENRLIIYECSHLTNEIISLERYENGKVDHPANGSKDAADAVCGSIYNASQHAEEFEFDFGEDLSLITQIGNITSNEESKKKQIVLDFEQELKKVVNNQDYFANAQPQINNTYLGSQFYLAQGIIIP